MAGSLLHFGRDLYDRVSVLRGAGYAVRDCRSAIQLGSLLQTGASADAVVFTEGFWLEGATALTRPRSPIPFILFEDQPVPNSDFDLVIPVHTPPAEWLSDVEALIARSREIRAHSKAIRAHSREIMARSEMLTREAKEVVERTQREVARSREERARHIPKMIENWGAVFYEENRPAPPATCPERNQLDMSILFSLARLTQVLHRMIRAGLESGTVSGSLETLKIEHDLECATLESLLTQWKAHRTRHRC